MKEIAKDVSLLISPFTPHMAEELWTLHNGKGFAAIKEWPKAKKLTTKQGKAVTAMHLAENTERDLDKLFQIIKRKRI